MYRILRLQKEYTGITIRTQNIDREASAGLKPLKNLVYLGPGTLRNLVVKYCYFVCCISSSRFGVEPGPTAHDLVFVVQRCNSTEFFFIGLCRTGAKLPQTCLCCRRLLVGSDAHCIAIRLVTLTLVFCSLESLMQF